MRVKGENIRDSIYIHNGLLEVEFLLTESGLYIFYFTCFGVEYGPFSDDEESLAAFNHLLNDLEMDMGAKKYLRSQYRKILFF
ncbi:MAG: hypothetical protein GF349_01230 [Candidatus Magasanikbacteria bacterium]|nr:hypothetical protein [Candidatus Magasanikbacteria bacterium]